MIKKTGLSSDLWSSENKKLSQSEKGLRSHLCVYYIVVFSFNQALFTAHFSIDFSEDPQDVLASKNEGRNNLTYKPRQQA